MFHNRTYQFLPYLVAHTLCEPQDAMTGNPETLVSHEEALSGKSEARGGLKGALRGPMWPLQGPVGSCPEVVGNNQ